MIKLTVAIALLIGLLSLSGAAIGLEEGVSAAEFLPADTGVMSGGGYSLNHLAGCSTTTLTGSGYVLTAHAQPASSKSACCCTFMPFTRR